jgi:hypothetical protein
MAINALTAVPLVSADVPFDKLLFSLGIMSRVVNQALVPTLTVSVERARLLPPAEEGGQPRWQRDPDSQPAVKSYRGVDGLLADLPEMAETVERIWTDLERVITAVNAKHHLA